jgi:hypothetical protein
VEITAAEAVVVLVAKLGKIKTKKTQLLQMAVHQGMVDYLEAVVAGLTLIIQSSLADQAQTEWCGLYGPGLIVLSLQLM